MSTRRPRVADARAAEPHRDAWRPALPREADVVALADGSMPPERRAAVLAEVQRSPALATALADQQRVVALVRAAHVRAPATLRRRVQEMLEQSSAREDTSAKDHIRRTRRPSGAERDGPSNSRRPKGPRADG